ncbi:hypothetical protein [Variovorax guangxiensis]|uniref:Uncharacterized protein n=1 Tax=Variovorax guangxiensis TaxID=1775474 RepID=A0A502DY38_9BURK|nr:hypothetical protein [Variovorax guangxiensis]TPG26538.1 hypothetical protein EAH83_01840 [Variovorax ginsengisoli]TPG30263.1 hypothetical protein EAH82_01840 [Variovorax guangxiensis]
MKVTITTLKAPWPQGAKVGDVVSFRGEHAPAWAIGKFTPADEDAEVDHKYKPPVIVGDVGVVEPAAQHAGEAQAFIDGLRKEHEAEVADLRKQLGDGGKALQEALDANQGLVDQITAANQDAAAQRAQVVELQAKLSDAEKALAAAKPKGSGR